jgi:hypothetical protein
MRSPGANRITLIAFSFGALPVGRIRDAPRPVKTHRICVLSGLVLVACWFPMSDLTMLLKGAAGLFLQPGRRHKLFLAE